MTSQEPTQEQIDKLPKWAQSFIEDLRRARDQAIKHLNEHLDNETESPFYIDEIMCLDKTTHQRRYIQTDIIECDYVGIHLQVMLRDNVIDLTWRSAQGHPFTEVAIQPRASNCLYLKPIDRRWVYPYEQQEKTND